jgi:hypothetical protein
MVVVLFAFLKERVIRSIKIFNHLSVRLSKPIRCEFKSQNIKKPPNEDLLCRQYGCFWSEFQAMRLSLTGIWTSQLFLCQDLRRGWILWIPQEFRIHGIQPRLIFPSFEYQTYVQIDILVPQRYVFHLPIILSYESVSKSLLA